MKAPQWNNEKIHLEENEIVENFVNKLLKLCQCDDNYD